MPSLPVIDQSPSFPGRALWHQGHRSIHPHRRPRHPQSLWGSSVRCCKRCGSGQGCPPPLHGNGLSFFPGMRPPPSPDTAVQRFPLPRAKACPLFPALHSQTGEWYRERQYPERQECSRCYCSPRPGSVSCPFPYNRSRSGAARSDIWTRTACPTAFPPQPPRHFPSSHPAPSRHRQDLRGMTQT